jgi:hypothetical protein
MDRVHIRRRRTFDSGATPVAGPAREVATLSDVDLHALTEKLNATQKRRDENDPAKLWKRIRELERQIQEVGKVQTVEVEKIVEVSVPYVPPELKKALLDLELAEQRVAGAREKVEAAVEKGKAGPVHTGNQGPARRPIHPKVDAPSRGSSVSVAQGSSQDSQLTGPEKRILNALAWLESIGLSPATRAQVAFLAKYKPGGAAFKNPLAAMNTKAWVLYPSTGLVQLTSVGRDLAEAPAAPLTTDQLQQMILDNLSGPQRRILQPLLEVYPQSVTKTWLAEQAGYEATGAAFKNPLASLRTLGLVDYPSPGMAAATSVSFIERAA